MKIFRIVQIGDIHFTDPENFELSVDNKDTGFPSALSEAIGTSPLQAVFRQVAHILERREIHLVSFMGDFTTRGDEAALQDCLRYLRRLFPVPWNLGEPPLCQVLIGNHDLDRRLDPNSDDRFERINGIFTAEGFPAASVSAPQEIALCADGEPQLRLFGLNSCKGCGQLRLLGGIIQRTAGPAIQAIISDPSAPKDLLDEIYENIDTPAVDDAAITQLVETLNELPEDSLPVICAHHNLLPQETPRLAPYTELVNAGSIRAALISCDRPLLYLHGHLHTDPVEVVRVPGRQRSAIVSIAAPIFRSGFNLLEIAFSESVPLGCRITPYRLQGSHVIKEATLTVPLWSAEEGLRLATRNGRTVMGTLRPDTIHYRADLLREMDFEGVALDDALVELQWLGVIQIADMNRPSSQWRITRSI
ncbi:MAG TPA: metallophosphoesterase [Allosphingosinicella sp.]